MRNDAFCLHHFAIDCEGAFEKPPDFLSINEFFSKITPSLFNGKEGRGDFRKDQSLWQKKDGSCFERILMAKEGRE